MTEGTLERLLVALVSERDAISTEHATLRIDAATALAEVCQTPGWWNTGIAAMNGNPDSRRRIREAAGLAECMNETWTLTRMIINAENGDTNHNGGH